MKNKRLTTSPLEVVPPSNGVVLPLYSEENAMPTKTKQSVSNGAEMILVDVNQRCDDWLEWRSQGVTASDIPIILGLSPYKTPWQLWAEKTGRINPSDLSKNPNVLKGIRLEDDARLKAEEKYDDILLPVCGECTDYPILRASFDGLDSAHEVYEFKCPSDSVFNHVKENDKVPSVHMAYEEYPSDQLSGNDFEDVKLNGTKSATYKLYEAQVHAQCVVSGNPNGHLIFYKEGEDILDFDVQLTTEKRETILEAAKNFWNHVTTDSPPEIDPAKDCFIPDNGNCSFSWQAHAEHWQTLHQRIKDLKKEQKSLEQEKKIAQEALVALMGDFLTADFGGVKITRFKKQGSIDYKKFLGDKFPDENFVDELENYRKDNSIQTRFTSSKDELVNPEANDIVVVETHAAYF